ncbi:hypothetical protein [Rhodanobacter koreensis]
MFRIHQKPKAADSARFTSVSNPIPLIVIPALAGIASQERSWPLLFNNAATHPHA